MSAAAKLSAKDRKKATRLENRITSIRAIFARGFDKNEIVIAKKVDPGKAETMARKSRLIRNHLCELEKALSGSAVQADLLGA